MDSNLEMARTVTDTPIENTAPLTVPEHGSAFINIDDDTDSDKDFRSGRLQHHHR